MNTPITIQDFFKLILFLLSIGAMGYLILIFKNISKLLKNINSVIEENEISIDTTIKQLPQISENINSITKNTDIAIKDLMPEINGLVHNINNISDKVGSITESIDHTTEKVFDTFDAVSDSITETAFAFQYNVKNINDYIQIVLEVIETIKNIIKKR